MAVRETRLQTSGKLLERASKVALTTSMNEEFFQAAGETASEAILREDLGALDMIYGGVDLKFRNPVLDRKLKLRLQGNRVILAGGIATLRRLKEGDINWPDRETNRESLTQAVDALLGGKPQGAIRTIAGVMIDAIQSFDPEYLEFGADQLSRLRADEAPEDLRILAGGMFDIVNPALTLVKGK